MAKEKDRSALSRQQRNVVAAEYSQLELGLEQKRCRYASYTRKE